MVALFRAMKDDGDGCPECGASARELGVRLDGDIEISDEGFVEPGKGGMSVSPESPMYLENHRRPPEFGGIGKDPVWTIDDRELPSELMYRADPEMPSLHGFIEPIQAMSLDAFQEALRSSRGSWEPVKGSES